MSSHSSKNKKLDFISIGDSTLDVFVHVHEASVNCEIEHGRCQLCFAYGEKVPVESVTKVPGAGNASNAAVGASRLGLRSAIVSILGQDEVGEEILRHWKKERVNTTHVQFDSKHETNYSTVLSFKGERTILVYSHPRVYVLPPLEETRWIYYTSLGAKHDHLEKQLIRHLRAHPEQKMTFNPGTNHLKLGLKALLPIVKETDVFIVNKEEAERLLGQGEEPIPNMLLAFAHLGPEIVVITDGEHGSYAADRRHVWQCPVFDGPVRERTGAGDSYGTAFSVALLRGMDIPQAMRWGTANAWSVVQHVGPQAGLLTEEKMEQVLKKFKKVQPKLMTNHG